MDSLALAREAISRHGAVQKLEELRALIDTIQRYLPSLDSVLEIGTQEGGTLWTWMQLAASQATLVSLDLDQSRNEQHHVILHQWLFPIEGDSHDPGVQAKVRDLLAAPVDLLFIDGDHTYEGVRADYLDYRPLVRPGGLTVLHDIAPSFHPDSHVDKLWAEIKTPNSLEFIDPNPVNIRNGAVLPAASCGIGVLFC